MINDKTGIEDNPLNLIHPVLYSKENLNYTRLALQQFKRDNTQQRPTPQLSKEQLEQMPEHKWLKQCSTTLINLNDYESEEQFLELFIKQLESESVDISEQVNLQTPRPLIALDTETTGLNKTVKKKAGKNIIYNHLVSICLATSETKGYYIPIRHNTLDNIPNISQETAIKLLQYLVDNFHIIYHNAEFDQEVLSLSGIRFKQQSFSDTMLIAILAGWRIEYKQVGLKFLSKELLNRPMLEINEITGQKNYIQMQNIPATNAYVYGCSDAINTYSLFQYLTDNPDENPYHTQKNTTKLVHSCVEPTRSMFRLGLPVNYNEAILALKTTIRRIIMLENQFYDTCSDETVSMSSAEQVGTHLFSILKREFEIKYNNSKPLNQKDKGFKILSDRLKQDFYMTVKVKELKAGTKIVADSAESVISSIYNNLYWDWISDESYNELILLTEILLDYRSLLNKVTVLYKLCRYAYNDDLNICRTGIALKLCGADTLRFSNKSSRSGAFDNLTITELRTKTNTDYKIGDGICGINAQGIASDTGTKIKLKRVINFKDLDQDMTKTWNKLNKRVENSLQQMFKTHKYHTLD